MIRRSTRALGALTPLLLGSLLAASTARADELVLRVAEPSLPLMVETGGLAQTLRGVPFWGAYVRGGLGLRRGFARGFLVNEIARSADDTRLVLWEARTSVLIEVVVGRLSVGGSGGIGVGGLSLSPRLSRSSGGLFGALHVGFDVFSGRVATAYVHARTWVQGYDGGGDNAPSFGLGVGARF